MLRLLAPLLPTSDTSWALGYLGPRGTFCHVPGNIPRAEMRLSNNRFGNHHKKIAIYFIFSHKRNAPARNHNEIRNDTSYSLKMVRKILNIWKMKCTRKNMLQKIISQFFRRVFGCSPQLSTYNGWA